MCLSYLGMILCSLFLFNIIYINESEGDLMYIIIKN